MVDRRIVATRAPETWTRSVARGTRLPRSGGHAVASPVRDSARLVARPAPTWRDAPLANGVQPAPSSATSPPSEVAESLVAPSSNRDAVLSALDGVAPTRARPVGDR